MKILKIAKNLQSSEANFIISILGTIVQAIHTYFAIQNASVLDGILLTIESWGIGIFFSMGLLNYTLKAGNEEYTIYQKSLYKKYAIRLGFFEGIVNCYYWTRKFVYLKLENKWIEVFKEEKYELLYEISYYDWFMALVFSIAIPAILATNAGTISLSPRRKGNDPEIEKINNRINKIENNKTRKFDTGKDKEGNKYIKFLD